MLNPKPCLISHKHLIWPPCGTVLTGGVHSDLSLTLAFMQMSVICFFTADLSHHQHAP